MQHADQREIHMVSPHQLYGIYDHHDHMCISILLSVY